MYALTENEITQYQEQELVIPTGVQLNASGPERMHELSQKPGDNNNYHPGLSLDTSPTNSTTSRLSVIIRSTVIWPDTGCSNPDKFHCTRPISSMALARIGPLDYVWAGPTHDAGTYYQRSLRWKTKEQTTFPHRYATCALYQLRGLDLSVRNDVSRRHCE